MSTKLFHWLYGYLTSGLIVTVLAMLACSVAQSQQMSATIRVLPESGRAIIEGAGERTSAWSFRDSYAGVLGLGNRIERFITLDENGNEIPSRRIAPGQFESARPASRFQYEVSLAPPVRAADSALVSWLTKERGLLILADLLPVSPARDDHERWAMIRISRPEAWEVFSNEGEQSQTGYKVPVDRAVFVAGNHLRSSHITESGMMFSLIADGEWAFADRDALEMAGKVLKAHRDVFGALPAKQGNLILLPFPQTGSGTQWTAETRGATVTLLMGKLPSKIGALAQLSTPLTHELFHLWVPNGLALEGDYDWFYEGFTIYQAARTAVRLDMLTFTEFLNSMARAYDGSVQGDPSSLIEASKRRFTIGQTSVYSKGQVVAFIYDLRLLSLSHGKRSLGDAYRALYRTYGSNASATASGKTDGNDATTQVLSTTANSDDFVQVFIRNPISINLSNELAPFGLKVERLGLRTYISVSDKLSKQQRDLLRELGYNDATHAIRSR